MNEFLVSDEVIEVDRIMADRLGLNGAVVYSCIMKEQTTNVNHLFNLIPFLSKSTIKRSIANIKAEGYLQERSCDPESLRERVINSHHLKNKYCEWCKGQSIVLHEHHYPIPKRLGGTETVSICPNCHYGYHNLEKGELI